MASIIDTIKAKIDVVEEIGLVVALQKSGRSFKGRTEAARVGVSRCPRLPGRKSRCLD